MGHTDTWTPPNSHGDHTDVPDRVRPPHSDHTDTGGRREREDKGGPGDHG